MDKIFTNVQKPYIYAIFRLFLKKISRIGLLSRIMLSILSLHGPLIPCKRSGKTNKPTNVEINILVQFSIITLGIILYHIAIISLIKSGLVFSY